MTCQIMWRTSAATVDNHCVSLIIIGIAVIIIEIVARLTAILDIVSARTSDRIQAEQPRCKTREKERERAWGCFLLF